MSSRWTNKNAILRDLSLAQGFEVPVDLDSTLAAGDRPPILNIVEDIDDEFFSKYDMAIDDIEASIAPDIGLIQHMLKMVQVDSSDSEDDNVVVEVSKPPESTRKKDTERKVELPATQSPEVSIGKTEENKKTKRRRENVAVNSILQGILDNKMFDESNTEPKTETLKLLKPTDFIPNGFGEGEYGSKPISILNSPVDDDSMKETNSIDKVTDWLSQHYESSPISGTMEQVNGSIESSKVKNSEQSNNNSKKKLLNWEPTAMFKKKTVTVKSVDSDSVKSSLNQKSEAKATTTMYQPSTLANEYYQRFMERSKLNEVIKEDVWTRAEKIMKEIEEKKKTEVEVPTVSQQQTDSVTSLDEIRLPQHRHLLTEDCIVCETVKKNGIDINLKILQDTACDTEWLPGALEAKSWRKNL
ncbi:hypothetical protein evm_005351 [Chilo suppressalis]|nr:hypothetical protein evm_005351 [Chilo suppressalis]